MIGKLEEEDRRAALGARIIDSETLEPDEIRDTDDAEEALDYEDDLERCEDSDEEASVNHAAKRSYAQVDGP